MRQKWFHFSLAHTDPAASHLLSRSATRSCRFCLNSCRLTQKRCEKKKEKPFSNSFLMSRQELRQKAAALALFLCFYATRIGSKRDFNSDKQQIRTRIYRNDPERSASQAVSFPRDAQRDVLSTEAASQTSSILSLLSGKGSEISLPYANRKAMKDTPRPTH